MQTFHNYFESLFKNAKQNAVLIIRMDGTVTAFNPAFIENFGYLEDDLIGKNASVLFTLADQKKKTFRN